MSPTIGAIVPAHQAADTLGACLDGLLRAGFGAADIVVVDDGSADSTKEIAVARGVRVVRNERPLRPAAARNRGMAETAWPVVLFVDADVVLRGPVRDQLARHFADADVTAVIGSYDDAPRGGTVVSDYRNLLHHHTHQVAAGPSPTFWTGIGAVRRDAFDDAGGLRSEWENIEDVEFGLRLTAAGGGIRLDPAIQGTHLKRWTPASMFRTDLHGRAVPWTRLLRAGRAETGHLNTRTGQKVSALGVAAMALGTVLALAAPAAGAAVVVLGAAMFLGGSAGFLSALRRLRGTGFMLRALPWHALHYVAALLGYAKVRLGLDRAAPT